MAVQSFADLVAQYISAGRLDLRSDVIVFRGTVPTSGSITQPGVTKLQTEYDYYITEIRASITGAGNTADTTTADTQYNDLDELSFNIRESGKNADLFSTSQELQIYCNSRDGNPIPLRFDPGAYKLNAGTDITLTLSRRATTLTTQRIVVIGLVCVLLPAGWDVATRKRLTGK